MSNHSKAIIALLATALLWGSAGTTGKLLLREAHPFVITFWRFAGATLIVLPFFLKIKKPKNWLRDLFPLAIFNASNVLFYYTGLTLTTANSGSLIGAGVPILTALLSWFIIKEPVSREKAVGVVLGLVGAVLIILVPIIERGQAVGTSVPGNLLMVGSTVAWSLYILRSRSVTQKASFHPVLATFVNFAGCTIAAGVAALLSQNSLILPALGNPGYAMLYLYTVIGVTVVTFFLFQWAVSHLSATTASLKEYVQLIFAVSINAIVLGERFTPVFFIGSFLIVSGVVIATGQRAYRKLAGLFMTVK